MGKPDKTDQELGEEFDDKKQSPQTSTEGAGPGGELFGDVVGSKGERRRAGRSAPAAEDDVQLRDSVKSLYDMVKDLEVQLNHMISINEAAERDLDAARRAQRALEKERTDLARKIDQMDRDAQSGADLREELRHMTQENERLLEQMRVAHEEAEKLAKQRDETGAVIACLQRERDDAAEEIECLEAQIAQATSHIRTQREENAKLREAREREARKAELIEQRLHVVTEERDALKQELNESRSALEEIKRSIMDNNMQSQLSYYES